MGFFPMTFLHNLAVDPMACVVRRRGSVAIWQALAHMPVALMILLRSVALF